MDYSRNVYWPTRLWKPILQKPQWVLSNQTFSECRASINLILPLNTAKGDVFAMYYMTIYDAFVMSNKDLEMNL